MATTHCGASRNSWRSAIPTAAPAQTMARTSDLGPARAAPAPATAVRRPGDADEDRAVVGPPHAAPGRRRPAEPVEGGAGAEHDQHARRRRPTAPPSAAASGPAAMRNGPPISQAKNAPTCSQPRSSGRSPRLSAELSLLALGQARHWQCALLLEPVGQLDLSARDPEQEEDGVEVGHARARCRPPGARRGLALKAMPSPAAASMSMSLAPSPTAMVRASGTPAASAKRASAVRLAGPVDDRPVQLPGDDPAVEHEHVGRQVVDAEVGHQRGR